MTDLAAAGEQRGAGEAPRAGEHRDAGGQPAAVSGRPGVAFDPAGAYRLHPDVALRPEPFGALAYHYGSRRLTFLRSAQLAELVRSLEQHQSAAAALSAAVSDAERPAYERALTSLAASGFICAR
jgi:mycofactocin biosynthesis protein MftB